LKKAAEVFAASAAVDFSFELRDGDLVDAGRVLRVQVFVVLDGEHDFLHAQVGDIHGVFARAARTTPPCTFWYLDGGSVNSIALASIEAQ
jgi:hypothetical protein